MRKVIVPGQGAIMRARRSLVSERTDSGLSMPPSEDSEEEDSYMVQPEHRR